MRSLFSGEPDFARAEDAMNSFCDIYDRHKTIMTKDDIFCEYLELSRFIQALFISDDGYVIDTGNFQTVNREILQDIFENVKTNKKAWKKFMVC